MSYQYDLNPVTGRYEWHFPNECLGRFSKHKAEESAKRNASDTSMNDPDVGAGCSNLLYIGIVILVVYIVYFFLVTVLSYPGVLLAQERKTLAIGINPNFAISVLGSVIVLTLSLSYLAVKLRRTPKVEETKWRRIGFCLTTVLPSLIPFIGTQMPLRQELPKDVRIYKVDEWLMGHTFFVLLASAIVFGCIGYAASVFLDDEAYTVVYSEEFLLWWGFIIILASVAACSQAGFIDVTQFTKLASGK